MMAAWADGYFTEIQYTANAYAELAPGFMAFACLRHGVRPPDFGAGSTYLELGCGQGFGLNLMAAANPDAQFWGVDFHPGQIDNAIRLARDGGLANVTFEDLSFEQLLEQPSGALPRFDMIALHGIYSWVSAQARSTIVRLLDRLLKPGGLVYVSYNCLPGWASLAPLQKFIAEHAAQGSGAPQARIIAALQVAKRFADTPGSVFHASSAVRMRIEEAMKEDPAYLAHEYLNKYSQPLFHAEVASDFEAARLTFAASANIADDFMHLAAPGALQDDILGVQDPILRQTLLDYSAVKPFRRDIFVRGRNSLDHFDQNDQLDGLCFALMTGADAVLTEFPIPIGRLTGQPVVYQPLITALATGPKSLAELRALPALAGAAYGAVLQALAILTGARQIHPLRAGTTDAAPALRFNREVCRRVARGETWNSVAAAAAGAPLRIPFSDQLAMHAVFEGIEDDAEAARLAWPGMARSGRRLMINGQVLQDQAANEAELAARIGDFRRYKLLLFQQLGAI